MREIVREEVRAANLARNARLDSIVEALYRAGMIVCQSIKPGKNWRAVNSDDHKM